MFAELVVNIVASGILVGVAYIGGVYRERFARTGHNLEDFEFYPFGLDDTKTLFFDITRFKKAVHYLLRHRNHVAARQLILVGRQNDVDNQLTGEDLARYKKLYRRYNGDRIHDDNARFLENFKRIVRLVGDSFPDSGIEILLHDLTNPATALTVIKNNVTGREIGAPATNLVLDLKMRREQNQDKLNYELNIGSRKFKCTTIPIFREPDGLVGAICINVDANYLTDEVLRTNESMTSFIRSLCRTDMTIDENILSREEYRRALAGKRHFRDFAVG